MKHPFSYILAAALITCLTMLSGCGVTDNSYDSSTAPPAQTTELLREQYLQAASSILSAEGIQATITQHTQTTVNGYTFTEGSVQEFSCLYYGTESMVADLQQAYTFGTHTVSVTEYYDSGTCAMEIDGVGFVAALTPQQYCDRLVPPVLLDASNYQAITFSENNGNRVLTFSQPTAAESWLSLTDGIITSIEAQAVLSPEGSLVGSFYSIAYTVGTTEVLVCTTVELDTANTPTLEHFPDTSEYLSLSDPNIPLILERATGYILQATSITSSFTESILCQAGGLSRKQTANIDLFGDPDSLLAKLERTIDLSDYTQGTTTQSHQVETFLDGNYTIDGNSLPDGNIDAAQMRTYCQDTLVFPILLPRHITGMTVAQDANFWLLTFTVTEELSQLLCSNTCQTLYGDSDVLNNLASSYETNYTTCSLRLDKQTGLPTHAQLRYAGTHTIAGYAYQLSYEFTQTYDLCSESAYETITGKPHPGPASNEPA